MMGLTPKKAGQKANIKPEQKIIIIPYRLATNSIADPITSAAIGTWYRPIKEQSFVAITIGAASPAKSARCNLACAGIGKNPECPAT